MSVPDGSIVNPPGGGVLRDAATSDANEASETVDPCAALTCNPGQRCERSGSDASCVDQRCEDLSCAETERCETHSLGGHVCADARCDDDVDCPRDAFCQERLCRADLCEAGFRTCDGQTLRECSENGSGEVLRFSCERTSYFGSVCVTSGGSAACSCQGDWDCPEYTVCEAGRCEGTGLAPTCSLPAIPFSATPPAVELHWGGDSRDDASAHDGTAARTKAPWPASSQVLSTPMVANLDDDNGDGLINELDFPEILFVTHQGNNPWSNGIVRAIHGGGPNKGADYFARCGNKLWTRASPSSEPCGNEDPDADSGAPLAIGDLDNDGKPEIVYNTEDNKFRILDHTGALRFTLAQAWPSGGNLEAISIANLDYRGYAEIIIGRVVYVLGDDGQGGIHVSHVLSGDKSNGSNGTSSMACVADVIAGRRGQEIAVGATLYALPEQLPSCASAPCGGKLDVIWHAPDVPGNAAISGNGFCAVADIWGADFTKAPGPQNRPDGKPEVILIDDGDLTILDSQTGKVITDRELNGGFQGGAPNVDDFDGDGFMEVASALQNFYVVVDLQEPTDNTGACPSWPRAIARKDGTNGAHNTNPARMPGGSCSSDEDCADAAVCNRTSGSCVCLHNGWMRDSDDDSSRATSSSVFDFNGDGAAEAVYNDECDFRVYDGRSGEVLFSQVSRSRTAIENPVVADVDNDGNAEVVTGMNTAEANRCDDDPLGVPQGPNGLRVWGDPTDTWVSARRIWNQQSYHVTNVTERGGIPVHPPESWKTWDGRTYNTYRSQPRNFGVAPDLTVVGLGVSSPNAQCGSLSDRIDIAVEIENAGDLRVGPEIAVRFFGRWDGTETPLLDEAGNALERTLQQSLEPGRTVVLTVPFAKQSNGRDELPSEVRAVVDPTSTERPHGAERECREDNNERTAPVDAGRRRPDLTLELGEVVSACPDATVETIVRNLGSAPAESIVVRYYAGDPAQGGTMLHERALDGSIEPGADRRFDARLAALSDRGAITVFAVVDPDRAIDECNEANNRTTANSTVDCGISPD